MRAYIMELVVRLRHGGEGFFFLSYWREIAVTTNQENDRQIVELVR